MEEKSNPADARHPPAGWRVWLKRGMSIVLLIGVMDAILFGVAGRIDWTAAWIFSGLYFAFLAGYAAWGTLKAPDLLKERSRQQANVKGWDKVILRIYSFLLIGLLVCAALDAGRFRWSLVPAWVQISAGILLAPAGGIILLAMAVNRYLSRWARIQDDRGQQVATSGPYRIVRHPMYAGIIMLVLFIPLVLGSWWALVPGSLIGALFVLRTSLEDCMLLAELPGYREYADRVRYRLVPGIW